MLQYPQLHMNKKYSLTVTVFQVWHLPVSLCLSCLCDWGLWVNQSLSVLSMVSGNPGQAHQCFQLASTTTCCQILHALAWLRWFITLLAYLLVCILMDLVLACPPPPFSQGTCWRACLTCSHCPCCCNISTLRTQILETLAWGKRGKLQ